MFTLGKWILRLLLRALLRKEYFQVISNINVFLKKILPLCYQLYIILMNIHAKRHFSSLVKCKTDLSESKGQKFDFHDYPYTDTLARRCQNTYFRFQRYISLKNFDILILISRKHIME